MERKDAHVEPRAFPTRRLEPLDEFQVLGYSTAAIEEVGGTACFDFVIASGGRVSGFHHGYSDLDLYFCPVGDNDVPRHLFEYDGCVVQFNRVRREVAADIALGMRSFTYGIDNRYQVRMFDHHRYLISRMVTATRVWVTEDGRAMLDAVRPDVYKRLAMALWARKTGRMLEDVAGALAVGDLAIACRAGAEALVASLECALCATGDLHTGESLLWRRVANNAVLAPLQPAVLSCMAAMHDPSGPEITRTLRSASRLASVLASAAQLEGWHEDWSELSVHPEELGEGGPPGARRTDPYHVVLRYADAIAINGPDRALRCDEKTVRVWLSANSGAASDRAVEMLDGKGLLA